MLIHRRMNMLLNSLTGFQCILSNLRDCRRSFPIGQQHLLHTDMVRRWLRQNISQMFLDITHMLSFFGKGTKILGKIKLSWEISVIKFRTVSASLLLLNQKNAVRAFLRNIA